MVEYKHIKHLDSRKTMYMYSVYRKCLPGRNLWWGVRVGMWGGFGNSSKTLKVPNSITKLHDSCYPTTPRDKHPSGPKNKQPANFVFSGSRNSDIISLLPNSVVVITMNCLTCRHGLCDAFYETTFELWLQLNFVQTPDHHKLILTFSSCGLSFTGLGVELVSCDLLREGAPIEPVPPVTHWKPDAVVREATTLLSV